MALYLPRWATDCLKRHDRTLSGLSAPLALYEAQKGAMRLVEIDRRAQEAGLFVGQNLADARALCPGLVTREIDRAFLVSVFAEFADWHAYASPIVCVLTDKAEYGDLVLDITGVDHLFGGERAMLEAVTGRLRGFGFAVGGAIASSVGAAWALAHFAPGQVIDRMGQAEDVLSGLPVAALRLDGETVAGLKQMGLKHIGQLHSRDRRALQARFGGSLLRRLDQALGHIEECVEPRLPATDLLVDRKFAEPILMMEDVLLTAEDLAHRLCGVLEREGLGAQTFHLMLFRVDHKVMVLSVNAASATRDAAHIARLLANRVERLTGDFDAGYGIEMVRLAASSTAELGSAQWGAFDADGESLAVEQLHDRLSSRLGPQAVTRIKPVDTHIPERAVRLEPVVARTEDAPDARAAVAAPRPLRLLPRPEPIGVVAEVPDGPPARMEWRRLTYRFVKTSGPERIGVEWWQPGEAGLTRDYYVGEDEEGRRFWLYREGLYGREAGTPCWFMHGMFS